MKKRTLFILVIFLFGPCKQGFSQDLPDLVLMGPVPVALSIPHHDIAPSDSFGIHVGAGILRLNMGSHLALIQGRAVVRYVPGQVLKDYRGIQFQVQADDKIVLDWTCVCCHGSREDCMADTTKTLCEIMPGVHYLIRFSVQGEILPDWDIRLVGKETTPVLEGWRELEDPDFYLDSLGDIPFLFKPHLAGTLFEKKDTPIQSKRSKYLQFRFSPSVANPDSLLEYNWQPEKAGEAGAWTWAGSIITLPILNSSNQWVLRVRRPGFDSVRSYKVDIAPRWYQYPALWVTVCTGFLLSGYFIYTRMRYRRLMQLYKSQSQLTDQVMNLHLRHLPHMVNNSLLALKELIQEQKWTMANEFAASLNAFLKRGYRRDTKTYYTLAEELDDLNRYVEIHQPRFGFGFSPLPLDAAAGYGIKVPAGLFQPVAENAIKYNLGRSSEVGLLSLTMGTDENELKISIRAKGQPMVQQVTQGMPGSTGFGLHWVRTRLELHNRLYPHLPIRMHISFDEYESHVLFEFENLTAWAHDEVFNH